MSRLLAAFVLVLVMVLNAGNVFVSPAIHAQGVTPHSLPDSLLWIPDILRNALRRSL